VTTHVQRRDLFWVALIAVSFVIALAVSWERWGNLLVDCGREMNQPLRLSQGEMLYSDVRHIYGPLSPYINATLFRFLGPSLGVLYASGIVSAAIILSLTYWISRRLLGPAASAAATLSVTWLCAFKQAGNYILPYAYSALHGCALGLASVALLLKALSSQTSSEQNDAEHPVIHRGYLFAAGVMAGLAMLAKTEMGLAAIAAGAVAAATAGYPRLKRSTGLAAIFLAPAVALVALAYSIVAARVGWATLARESYLFLSSLPPELVYFNKRISGFDQPILSLMQMFLAGLRMASLAAVVATAGMLLGGRWRSERGQEPATASAGSTDAGHVSAGQLWLLLMVSLLVFLSIPLAGVIGWDKGPYLAMPLILLALLFDTMRQGRNEAARNGRLSAETLVLVALIVYALASLARVVLRVRSGGAYSSYLLPASVILFTYVWTNSIAARFRDISVSRMIRNIGIGLILADVAGTAPLLAYRFRARNTYPISTARGTHFTVPDLGQAMNEAIIFITNETAPTDSVAVLPEGTSLNFLTGRRNPLREEIITPGYLDPAGEERAINQLEQSDTRLVLVTNRPTSEFGATVLGRDYCQKLMSWIEGNFERVATFGPSKDANLEIGDKTFFIRAYRKREQQVHARR
jgi:hypothetical protein